MTVVAGADRPGTAISLMTVADLRAVIVYIAAENATPSNWSLNPHPPAATPDDWQAFWKSREVTSYRDTVWRMNMKYFVCATESVMRYSPDDVVLDIGCGAGYLHECLRERVRKVRGVDVSELYLGYCREKFDGISNCLFSKLDEEDYTDLSFLPSNKYTKIVCLSVVQYYDQKLDLRRLLESVKRVAVPGALCLVADIPPVTARGSDTLSLLKLAARERHLLDTIRYLAKMRFSEYHSVRAKRGVLRFSPQELLEMADELDVAGEVIVEQLTVNRSRNHLLVRF